MVREQRDPASWMYSNRTSKSGLRPARLTPELAFLSDPVYEPIDTGNNRS